KFAGVFFMCDDVKSYLEENDQFAEHVGVEVLEVGEGEARAKLELGSEHLNSLDTVHGAAIFTLADVTFAAVAHVPGRQAPGIQVSVNYFRAISEGTLVARGEIVHDHPKLATYRVEIKNEEEELIADFEGTVYRTKKKYPPE
ncbi:MAG: PaaI family thioesterase, partial [bacterium]